MSDVSELVKRLREPLESEWTYDPDKDEAADALTAQQAEIGRLRAVIEMEAPLVAAGMSALEQDGTRPASELRDKMIAIKKKREAGDV